MKSLRCNFLIHRGKENISLHFEIDPLLVACFRKSFSLAWSRQHTCWYCLCTRVNFEYITKICQQNGYVLEFGQLRSGMLAHKQRFTRDATMAVTEQGVNTSLSVTKNNRLGFHRISESNRLEMEKFVRHLHLKSYSSSTVRTYSNELLQFMAVLKKHTGPCNTD